MLSEASHWGFYTHAYLQMDPVLALVVSNARIQSSRGQDQNEVFGGSYVHEQTFVKLAGVEPVDVDEDLKQIIFRLEMGRGDSETLP